MRMGGFWGIRRVVRFEGVVLIFSDGVFGVWGVKMHFLGVYRGDLGGRKWGGMVRDVY
jgi:hypothetical protein